MIGLDSNDFVVVRNNRASPFDIEVLLSRDVLDNPIVIALGEPPLIVIEIRQGWLKGHHGSYLLVALHVTRVADGGREVG